MNKIGVHNKSRINFECTIYVVIFVYTTQHPKLLILMKEIVRLVMNLLYGYQFISKLLDFVNLVINFCVKSQCNPFSQGLRLSLAQ